MHVAVIGAGLLGAGVARELQRQGAQTAVFEACKPGHGTSSTTFAWVNSHDKRPVAYHELNVAGMHAHRDLRSLRTPSASWFFPTGNLEWAEDDAHGARLAATADRLRASGYRARSVTACQVARMEPDVTLPPVAPHAVFFPDEGYVLPLVLIGRLLGEARDLGAEIFWPARVVALDTAPDGVRLRFADGGSHRADTVVSCAGWATSDLLATAGIRVPLVAAEGQGSAATGYLGYTAPAPVRLRRILTTPKLNVRPDGAGRMVLQALDLDSTSQISGPADPDGLVAAELTDRVNAVFATAGDVAVDAVRVGHRVLPADGLTVAGRPDGNPRVYVLATHSGVTLAPLLGRLAAREITGDTNEPILDGFGPDRFKTSAAEAVMPSAPRRPGEQ